MGQPTPSDVHIDRPLTTIAVAYAQTTDNFVSTQAFPIVPVDKQSDKYFIYNKNDWFRDEAQVRPPATESAGSGYNVSTDNYYCDVWALHKDVDDQLLNNADAPISPLSDAAKFVTQRLLLRREIQWASDYFKTGVWGNSVTPSSLWSDYTASDPVGDVDTGKQTVLLNTGFRPNTLVLGYPVWTKLRNHPDIIARVGGGATTDRPATVTKQQVAAILEIDRLIVAESVYATNKEGETAAMSFIHGKHALLVYAASSPSLLAPSAGYNFVWRGVSYGMGQDIGVKQIPMPTLNATRVEGQVAFDNKVVATDLGYFLESVVA